MQQARVLIDRDPVVHLERVAFQGRLELLVAIVGETHRTAVRIHRADETVERHVEVVLRPIADGVARMDEQILHRECALRDHAGRAVRDLGRRLGRHDHVQRLRRGVVPAVRVVGFERGRVDRLRVVFALHHQPVRRRVIQLLLHLSGIEHALLVELAVFDTVRPHRLVLTHHAREHRCVFQAGEDVVVIGRLAADAHEAERAPRIALERPGLRAITDDLILELQFVFRETEAREVVIDQDRDRLAEIRGRLARRQQHVVAVEGREDQAVARQIVRRHHAVRLQFVAEQREIEAFVAAVGLRRAQDEGVRLLLWPVRHVGGANVAREHLRTGHFGDAVDAEFRLTVGGVPLNRRQNFVFEQRSKCAATHRRDIHRHPRQHAGLQKTTTRKVEFPHGLLL